MAAAPVLAASAAYAAAQGADAIRRGGEDFEAVPEAAMQGATTAVRAMPAVGAAVGTVMMMEAAASSGPRDNGIELAGAAIVGASVAAAFASQGPARQVSTAREAGELAQIDEVLANLSVGLEVTGEDSYRFVAAARVNQSAMSLAERFLPVGQEDDAKTFEKGAVMGAAVALHRKFSSVDSNDAAP
jgi:hypothetical protein